MQLQLQRYRANVDIFEFAISVTDAINRSALLS